MFKRLFCVVVAVCRRHPRRLEKEMTSRHRCARRVKGFDEPGALTRAALRHFPHGQALLSAGPVVCNHLDCVGQCGGNPRRFCAYQVVESLSRRTHPAAHIKESS